MTYRPVEGEAWTVSIPAPEDDNPRRPPPKRPRGDGGTGVREPRRPLPDGGAHGATPDDHS